MKRASTPVVVLVGVSLWSAPALAKDRFDIGLLGGWAATSEEGSVLKFDRSTSYQATLGWPVWRGEAVILSIEVPFIATPALGVVTPGSSLPKEFASLYLTPGVRVTFVPNGPVSFFGVLGGGYARYSESKERVDKSPNPQQRDTNTGALAFGVGIDVDGGGWLGARGEVRDVYTGARQFSIPTPGEPVHNVVISVGLVVKF